MLYSKIQYVQPDIWHCHLLVQIESNHAQLVSHLASPAQMPSIDRISIGASYSDGICAVIAQRPAGCRYLIPRSHVQSPLQLTCYADMSPWFNPHKHEYNVSY